MGNKRTRAIYGLPLDEKEIEVLTWLAHGKTYGSTAIAMHYSLEWIKDLLGGARIKLGAYNTTHAVAIAIRSGQILMEE